MFYLHFLALPMFFFLRNDISTQFLALNSGPRTSFDLPYYFISTVPLPSNSTFISKESGAIQFPVAYLPLLVNTLTQLLCVAGVHRLTTRVSSLTVTLVLVVRKAVSLVISVLGIGMMGRGQSAEVNKVMMWTGAGIVLLGTVGYSVGSKSNGNKSKNE